MNYDTVPLRWDDFHDDEDDEKDVIDDEEG